MISEVCSLWFLKVVLINGQFPRPTLDAVPNDNLIINVIEETIV